MIRFVRMNIGMTTVNQLAMDTEKDMSSPHKILTPVNKLVTILPERRVDTSILRTVSLEDGRQENTLENILKGRSMK